MATGKVTNCFKAQSGISAKEFDRIETAAKAVAKESGRVEPINQDYVTVVKGLLESNQKKLDGMLATNTEITNVAKAETAQQGSDKGSNSTGSAATPGAKETATEASAGSTASKNAGASEKAVGSNAKGIESDLRKFMRVGTLGNRVVVVQSAKDLPSWLRKSVGVSGDTQAFVSGGKAYLIADNIAPGKARSVFLHEVGAHLGMENLLGDHYDSMVDKIVEWSGKTDGSLESKLAVRALKRVRSAGTPDAQANTELVAYFIEEAVDAGVNPMGTTTGPLAQFMRRVRDAFKAALTRLGFNTDKLTAQDFVDIAYGAARMEMKADGAESGSAQSVRWSDKDSNNPVGRDAFLKQMHRKMQDAYDESTSPDDAVDEFMAVATPQEQAFMRALKKDDYLGFDYPHQAIEAIYEDLQDGTYNFDLSPQLKAAISRAGNAQFSKASTLAPISLPKNSESLLRSIGGTTATKLAADLGGYAKQALDSMTYLPDLVDDLKHSIPAASTWYKGMMDVQARRNQLAEKAERIAAKVDKLTNGAKAVNAFLAKSTMAGKWGYDITIDGTKVQADPAMAVEFNKLLPDEQALVKDVFQNGIETLKAKRDILKKLGLNDSLFVGGGTMMTPYAPLKRFGNFVAVAKSKELLAATKEDDIERLKKDPKHYLVSHFDTRGQAKVWAQEKAKEFAFTDSFPKEERASELGVTNMALLNKVLAAVKASDLPTESMEAMRTLVQDMYFQAVDEHNARTAGLQRMGRYGFEEDMMRSFLHNAKAQANFLAHLEFGGEVNDAFYKMKAQAKDSVTGKRSHQDAFNMLTAHYADSLKTENTPIQDRITAFTSVMQLATSIGYHVANFTQTLMVSGPKLAADFNNWHGAMGHIFRAYPLLRNINLSGNFNFDAIKDTGLRNMLQRAADMGVLDVGMDENLSHLEATRTGYAALDKTGSVLNKAVHNLRKVSRAVETANRVAAAVAGYRMSMESKNDVDAAQAYAIRLLQTTQGDFSRTAAPLLLKRLPKVMVQYKKFQFMMAALYVRGFNDAFRGETPEVRATGRRLLAYQLAHTSVAAGALGLPLVNAIGTFMLGLLGDDDEPKDLERWLREKIDDKFMADAILKGPASMIGLDLSAKLGHDKIFSVLPYTDVDFTSAKGFRDMAFGLIGGASGSQAAKMMDGFGYLSRGDYQKGFENLTPKGVADMSKAFRIANEGFTLKDGTTMVSTEDVNGAALAFDALGLKSSAVRRMEWLRGQQYEIRQFYSDKTSELKREYVRATKDGDGDTKAKLRDEWMRLQVSKREMRRWFGDSDDALKTSPLSDLTRAPLQAAKKDLKAQREFAARQ